MLLIVEDAPRSEQHWLIHEREKARRRAAQAEVFSADTSDVMPESEQKHPLEAVWRRHQAGDVQYAYTAYTEYLRGHPGDPTALHYLGVLAQQTGHPDKAIELLSESLAIDSRNMKAANHLGQVYAAARRWEEAAASFERAAELDPQSADPVNNLGNVMRQTGRSDEALALYRRAIAIDPGSREGFYNLGKALRDRRAFAEALRAFREAIRLDSRNYRAQYELALCLEELGQFPEAAAHYQAALGANPDHARSLANLLALRCFAAERALVERAMRVAEDAGAPAEARAKLHQGIGKYFDRQGEYSRAFAHFLRSNDVQSGWSKPSLQAASIARRKTAARRFDKEHFDRVRGRGNASVRPIFIVGMPRSGTTLIEQVLASHPRVYGAGELMEIPRIAAALAGPEPPSIESAAQRYLDCLASVAPPEALHVTDKLPINYRHLGVIATLFPRARIIHCRRDPRDVALSCFIEMFSLDDQDFTSLEGIALAIVEEAQLMGHWREVLPLSVYELDYHAFVTEQEAETRQLIEFCDLPWDERCLAFFNTARSIETPSRWQVRQPLYRTSDGRWRNYRRELEPACAIFQQHGLIAASD